MVAVQAGSVYRGHFFNVARAFGFQIEEHADHVVISRDTDPPFLEVWSVPEDQTFIFKRHVMRFAKLAKIPPHLFWNADLLEKYIAKNA